MGNCSSSDVTHPDTFTALPTFKIALVGESKAGKTAIFNRFVKNCFFKTYVPTKKVDIVNVIKKVNVPEHVIVSLTLWDTPGRDDIDMAHTYFSHIDAVIVVVDVTDKESMEMAAYWKQEIINTVTHHSDMSISDALKLPILLLGNKYDLVDKEKPGYESDENSKDFSGEKLDDSDELMIITEEEKWKPGCVHKIEQLVQQHGFLSGVMVSAKDSDGSVHQAMQTLIRKLMENTLQQMYGDEYKKRSKRRPKKQSKAIVETSLKLTEIESIDNYIRECEGPVQRITELKSAYEKTLHNIKLAFADAQLIPAEHYSKATLEQCITALKLELGDVLAMEEMEGGMIIIQINAEKRPKEEILNCQRKFNKGLNAYNEYAEICAIIYSETELLEESLRRLDAKILKSQSEIWETQKSEFEAAEMSKSQSDKAQPVDYKAVSAVIDSNRIQIAESLLWIEELNRHAVRARDKVSTALMW